MIRVKALPMGGQAYQFGAPGLSLQGFATPMGPVSVQQADELNRVEARAYVPTTWGMAVLSPGDWVVIFDAGIVMALTDMQFSLLFTLDDTDTLGVFEMEIDPLARRSTVAEAASVKTVALSGPPVLRAVAGGLSFGSVLMNYLNDYKLDYVLMQEGGPAGTVYRVVVNATGRVVVEFMEGDVVVGYTDGSMKVEPDD